MKNPMNRLKNIFYIFIISLIVSACSPGNDSNGGAETPIINAFNTNSNSDAAISIQFVSNQAGTAFYVLQLGGSEPSIAQIKSGAGNGGTVASSGSQPINVGINFTDLTSLAAGTSYTLYVMGQNASGVQSTIGSTILTTTGTASDDTISPIISLVSNTPSTTTATIVLNSDSIGTAFYLTQQNGNTPTATQIKNGTGNGGTVIGFSNISVAVNNNQINVSGLAQSNSYNVYVLVEDTANNQSTILTVNVVATSPVDVLPAIISLSGSNPQIIIKDASYTELGATATDNIDGDVSANISIDATAVDTTLVGNYDVIYTVLDAAGNTASVIRTVTIIEADAIAPIMGSLTLTPSITSAEMNFTSDEAGTVYFIAQVQGAVTPTKAQVKSAAGSLGSTVAGASSAVVISGNNTVAITSLTSTTSYVVFAFVEDAAGNQSDLSFKLVDTLSENISIKTLTITSTGTTTVDFDIDTTDAGTAYYIVQSGGVFPTQSEIKSGNGNNASLVRTSGNFAINSGVNSLQATGLISNRAYNLYVYAEDANGTESTVKGAATFTPKDSVPPTINATSISNIQAFTADFNYTASEESRLVYVVKNGGDAPSATDLLIKNFSGLGGIVPDRGDISSIDANAATTQLKNLQSETDYILYFVIQDTSLNNSGIQTIAFSTVADTVAPTLTAASATASDNTATLQFTSNEGGVAYFIAQQAGSAPSALQVKNATGNSGSVVENGRLKALADINSAEFTELSILTSYTFYVVVEDAAGNISNVINASATTSDDISAPKAVISFPTGTSQIEGQNSITLVGSTTDVSTITQVQVNGNDVVTSDNFANWSIDFPLVTGANVFQVSTSDNKGNSNNNAFIATTNSVEISLDEPVSIVFNKSNDQVLVLDSAQNALIAANITTGNKTLISAAGIRGTGKALNASISVEVDEASDTVYVLESAAIIQIDLATGNRSTLSDAATGSGSLIGPDALDFSIDIVNGLLYVLKPSKIIIVDTSTGDRSDLTNSNGDIVNITSLGRPVKGILYVSSLNSLFVSRERSLASDILEISISDGGLSIVSNANSGRSLSTINNLAYISGWGNLVVTPDLYEIKLGTGSSTTNREPFRHRNSAASKKYPYGLETDVAGDSGSFIYSDSDLDAIISVHVSSSFFWGNPTRGAQTLITSDFVGDKSKGYFIWYISDKSALLVSDKNEQLLLLTQDYIHTVGLNKSDFNTLSVGRNPEQIEMAIDNINSRIYVLEQNETSPNAIFELDLLSNKRTLISNSDLYDATVPNVAVKGTGVSLKGNTIAVDISNQRLLVAVPSLTAIVSVDIATGNRTLISQFSSGLGTGNNLLPDHMIIDETNNRLLGIDIDLQAIVAIDLNNGDRSVISDSATGSGTALTAAIKVAFDGIRNIFYVLDGQQVLQVNLSDGSRSIVSSNTTGLGIKFSTPVSIAVDSKNHRLFVADVDRQAVYVVNPTTGDRLVMSK